MKIIPIECPKCGASFEIEEGRNTCFCQYCGTHISIDDGSRTVTNTNIIRDEAKLKELSIKEKQLDHEMRIKDEQRKKKGKGNLNAFVIAFSIVCILLGLLIELIPLIILGIGFLVFGMLMKK